MSKIIVTFADVSLIVSRDDRDNVPDGNSKNTKKRDNRCRNSGTDSPRLAKEVLAATVGGEPHGLNRRDYCRWLDSAPQMGGRYGKTCLLALFDPPYGRSS